MKRTGLVFIFLMLTGLILSISCGRGSENVLTTTTTTVLTTSTTIPTGGNTYYLSPSGSDSNSGSETQPWKTFGHASETLQPGDTLIIKDGTYILSDYNQDRLVPPSGTASAWVVIKGETGKRPVLAGRGGMSHAIDISNKSYLLIENLEITSDIDNPYSGGLQDGIEAGGSAGEGTGDISNVILRNLCLHHIEQTGINFAGSIRDVTIENLHIHHTGGPALSAPAAGSGKKGWERVVISCCTLEYAGNFTNGEERRSDWDRPDGFGIEDSEGPIEIKYTTSRYNYGDGLDSKSKNTYIHHCIVANNFGDGVKLWGDGSKVENTLVFGTSYPSNESTPWQLLVVDTDDTNASIEVINCTFFDDERRANAQYVGTAQYQYWNVPIRLTLTNNIFAGLARFLINKNVTLTAQNNLFYNRADADGVQLEVVEGDPSNLNTYASYTSSNIASLGSGNIYGDPEFIRAEWGPNGDFHLQSGSPAIDAGLSTGAPSDDLDGKVRPKSSAVDIGCYEK
jgi:hypothetical protein